MKKITLFLLLCIVMFSCKNEVLKPGNTRTHYLTDVVGNAKDGKFEVTNAKAIKEAWESAKISDSVSGEISGFEIVHGLTEGDAKEEYYLLVATNKAGNVRTAAPLVLKGESFYFEEPGQTSAYLKTTCKSGCVDACNPVMKIAEGSRYLVCSPCADCRKVDSEMR
ncbi:MAG: hypothetical protein ACO1N9_08125 [Flavobacterium sp.]